MVRRGRERGTSLAIRSDSPQPRESSNCRHCVDLAVGCSDEALFTLELHRLHDEVVVVRTLALEVCCRRRVIRWRRNVSKRVQEYFDYSACLRP